MLRLKKNRNIITAERKNRLISKASKQFCIRSCCIYEGDDEEVGLKGCSLGISWL